MKYSRDYLEQFTSQSKTISEVLVRLGLNKTGGNHAYITKKIKEFNIDVSHFDGRGVRIYKENPKDLTCYLCIDPEEKRINGETIKKALLQTGVTYKCFKCGINEWCGEDLSLHIDHINGLSYDNRIENLRLLCPNCHSQTETYAGKNVKVQKIKHKCNKCNNIVSRKNKLCKSCAQKDRDWYLTRKVTRPTLEQLLEDYKNLSMVKIGQKYGVSDNAIRKWFKAYKYDYKS